jgi:tetratricopeptide (TPR) repeat protein
MAKKVDVNELQHLGKIAYEAKKYNDALDAFSKAIVLTRKWSPLDVLPILDLRVAVYVKLGNVELARKDATSMIRDNKSDSRGYLRCAQLERLQENLSAALRWVSPLPSNHRYCLPIILSLWHRDTVSIPMSVPRPNNSLPLRQYLNGYEMHFTFYQ